MMNSIGISRKVLHYDQKLTAPGTKVYASYSVQIEIGDWKVPIACH